jgi:hypothetical protein
MIKEIVIEYKYVHFTFVLKHKKKIKKKGGGVVPSTNKTDRHDIT